MPASGTSRSGTAARRRSVLFKEEVAGASYQGIFAGAFGAGLSAGDGRFDIDGGAKGVFVARDPSRNSAPMLRSAFTTSGKPIASARLYVTARGIYEVFLNGTRVGEDHYNPGQSQYNVTHFYQTYDVTSLVQPGQNAIGAVLSEGWWSGLLSFGAIWNHFGDRQSLLAKLVISYGDGTSDIDHDERPDVEVLRERPGRLWQPRLRGGVRHRRERPPWKAGRRRRSTTAGGSPRWRCRLPGRRSRVRTPRSAAARRRRSRSTGCRSSGRSATRRASSGRSPRRASRKCAPACSSTTSARTSSACRGSRSATAARARRSTLRFAEMLYPDLPDSGKNVGMIMTENYRAALSQDVYTMKAGRQVYQPRFTSHGFQYIEITGIDARAAGRRRRGRRDQLGAHAHGRLQDLQRQGEPALVEPGVVQRRQLPDAPHGLPAAQRTGGLVRRHQRLLAHGHLRLQRRPVPDAAHGRDARRPVAEWQVHGCRAGGRRFRRRPVGQCRHRRAVGGLPPIQGHGDPRTSLPGDGRLRQLPRDDARPEDRPEHRRPARGLAGPTERAPGERVPRHGLSRVRPGHHGEGRRRCSARPRTP